MKPQLSRKCKYCKTIKSFDNFYKDKSSRYGIGYGCKTCLKKYQVIYNHENRQKVTDASRLKRQRMKEILVAENGGKCVLCGYNRYIGALAFHHKDPSKKDYHVSSTGIHKARQEAKKCVLLCKNCHDEIHAGITSITSLSSS